MLLVAQRRRHVTRRIGVRIRRIREQQQLTLTALAAKAGYTKGSLSKIEHGKVNVPVETLDRLADALGVSLEDLVREDAGPFFRRQAPMPMRGVG
jgi:transcriptional regulator with XRE-family HTH domain